MERQARADFGAPADEDEALSEEWQREYWAQCRLRRKLEERQPKSMVDIVRDFVRRDDDGMRIWRLKVLGRRPLGFSFVYPDEDGYATCGGVEREIDEREIDRFMKATSEYLRAVARFEEMMNTQTIVGAD